MRAVTLGGASEENCGGAAEQLSLCRDPQWEHRIPERAGRKCTGTQRTRYGSQSPHMFTVTLFKPWSLLVCVHRCWYKQLFFLCIK